ncbi:hypothetical protein AtubIFM55763_002700 [Aspergillus tubingensis]|uniref:Uncharacterized protein n=1 Tax=Aspergillus tubingensis TaxID=5068 RepID=A0A8H3T2P0_ASPTU|nr:uncharacterized protein AtWU_10584 [Aspergillus tubingensis]GFN20777.1 hypothetical protein AtWU_10584 [Aspergillus tubingensis]GLA60964.1 hypothetical protein AtubIFM54640_001466 [Aspergillus tubingensis]GLA72178.1 hypothetical protein AtubIFM55763_002700 [Aspergillus tubingensis]GLA89097.1 hypothetical protein AtubIFM56815_003569 [Aspergillus tubingensis]GLA97128.1 hypothetical protein AtubIFM57143_004614 [Aspergillus tubingensis]
MAPSLQPHVTPDSFFHTTSPPRPTLPTNPPPAPIIVYFISGNPGLISYYYPFFTFLSDKLQSLSSSSSEEKKDHHQFYIHGHSLAGFEVQPQSPLPTHYHNVEDQIQFIQHKLDSFVQATTTTQPSTARRPRVIIMGHSVGTYIAMEVIRRHRERQTSAHSNSSITDFDIIGGVMLFPTVMDIASSPSGKKLTTLLSLIPHLALIVSIFARILTTFLPDFALRALIKLFMADPPSQAVDTTCAFLKSKRGVRQALHMAADEMRTITTDKWSDDVWGIASSSSSSSSGGNADDKLTASRMFFYFGRNDHWVAEKTREEIIQAKATAKSSSMVGRGKGGTGPTMVVCEDGLPHAFCLRHSEVTAGKVAGMVMDIIDG